MNWRDRIPGCFGAVDRIFAGHPADVARAREMLQEAWQAGATWAELEAEARAFLSNEGMSAEHIDAQITKMAATSTYLD